MTQSLYTFAVFLMHLEGPRVLDSDECNCRVLEFWILTNAFGGS
jgi:hypothetical protein